MTTSSFEESLELLTPGSNWFNKRSQKLVTALVITNASVPNQKFVERNPPQVVFLTETGIPVSIPVEQFLNSHTFYNVNVEIEDLVENLLAGTYSLGASTTVQDVELKDESVGEDSSSQPKVVTAGQVEKYQGKLGSPVEIQFLTVEGDSRQPPLINSDELKGLVNSVSQVPVIAYKESSLANIGVQTNLYFQGADPDFRKVIESLFDPSSVNQNYAGFQIEDEIFAVDAYLGTTVERSRSGDRLVVHLVQLEEDAEEDERVFGESEEPEEVQEVIPPQAEAPKDFASLAATLAERQSTPVEDGPTVQQHEHLGTVDDAATTAPAPVIVS